MPTSSLCLHAHSCPLATSSTGASPYYTSGIAACPAYIFFLPRSIAEMRHVYLWLGLLVLPIIVSPAMKHLWLGPVSGNANFMFNQQLLFALAGGSLTAEFVAAGLRLQRRERAALKGKSQA